MSARSNRDTIAGGNSLTTMISQMPSTQGSQGTCPHGPRSVGDVQGSQALRLAIRTCTGVTRGCARRREAGEWEISFRGWLRGMDIPQRYITGQNHQGHVSRWGRHGDVYLRNRPWRGLFDGTHRQAIQSNNTHLPQHVKIKGSFDY